MFRKVVRLFKIKIKSNYKSLEITIKFIIQSLNQFSSASNQVGLKWQWNCRYSPNYPVILGLIAFNSFYMSLPHLGVHVNKSSGVSLFTSVTTKTYGFDFFFFFSLYALHSPTVGGVKRDLLLGGGISFHLGESQNNGFRINLSHFR